MVKGLQRQVIVVKTPGMELFEEAIFIMRDGALAGKDWGPGKILREAKRTAKEYVRNAARKRGVVCDGTDMFAAVGQRRA